MKSSRALCLCAALAGTTACLLVPAYAAVPSDADLVAMCLGELKSRQPPEQAHSEIRLTASAVQRGDTRQVVSIQAATGEGRTLAGRCVIRDGKVFDFRD